MASQEYFIVMEDFGRRGREARVDPELTHRNVVDRIRSGEYKNISFIHRIRDCLVEDVTNELLAEAGFFEEAIEVDHRAYRWDHDRDARKHEVAG